MSKAFIWALKFLCRRIVKQGSTHKNNMIIYYRILWEAAENEFTEDNRPTLEAFLTECFEAAKAKGGGK